MKKAIIILCASLLLSGCSTEAKMLQNNQLETGSFIVNGQLLNILGMDNLSHIAFYLSKDVVLHCINMPKKIEFKEGTALQLTGQAAPDIRIRSTTSGLCDYNEVSRLGKVDYRLLGLRFDETIPDRLGFIADADNPKARFYLAYDDEAAQVIEYQGYQYKVSYKDEGRPYLIAKIKKEDAKKVAPRDLSGNKFD